MTTIKSSMLHPHPWVRSTSAAAWNSIKTSGWATKAMQTVYDVLYHHGPLTLKEIDQRAASATGAAPKGRSESTFVRRVYDLTANGLVVNTGRTRICSVSGKNASLYDVTSALCPAKRVRTVTKSDLMKRISELEDDLVAVRCPGCALRGIIKVIPEHALAGASARCGDCGTKIEFGSTEDE